MSTRRRIGVSIATTEAARRQLMQPVVCWEKVWTVPENAAPNSSVKIYKWVKTDRKQQFSDDEGEVDEPLAPLPDEPEVVEGDEEMDQDEPVASVAPDADIPAVDTETNSINQEIPSEPQTKPSSPTPPALSLQATEPILVTEEVVDMLDESLKALDGDVNIEIGVHDNVNLEEVGDLDMTVLGPDGTTFESVHDLSQMDSGDALLGGPLMDQTVDPFAVNLNDDESAEGAAP
ncbi:uncharacterized protein BJ212DRAFT_293934 [Suillus subaureus]|uniref:Uncharacterized protein n=1 Tax=Suillus subaureus TaxID=48587 RepID=A0A9P7EN39_9AGAM|nr:uncharacterized protein BJ212DRAFT_293934 [Suillus subaureus]KAG1825724.1 hypothetical protein BJ212DRAFT_293934 [Suillus subaureus]